MDFWIEGRSIAAPLGPALAARAALAELLPRARDRSRGTSSAERAPAADAARQAGVQVTASSTRRAARREGSSTAWRDGAVELWAADPATPLAAPAGLSGLQNPICQRAAIAHGIRRRCRRAQASRPAADRDRGGAAGRLARLGSRRAAGRRPLLRRSRRRR
ncbi:MAG: hypothetical protein KF782_17945 [Labilithrix sp.]|nr:hypothetical protein [Labilithrix sp.]